MVHELQLAHIEYSIMIGKFNLYFKRNIAVYRIDSEITCILVKWNYYLFLPSSEWQKSYLLLNSGLLHMSPSL